LSDQLIIMLVLFSALAAPFFLPQMHDRYYFVADVFLFVVLIRRSAPSAQLQTTMALAGS